MAKILIIEDEIPIHELIQRNLKLVGHECFGFYDGRDVSQFVKENQIDLVVLDVMLPGLDGFQVYQTIQGTPTIFLTAKSNLQDRVKGLTMGADDYLVKPFEMLELIARVDAVLRRSLKEVKCFEIDDVRVDFDSRQIFKGGCLVDCTPQEYELLDVLIRNRNMALSRDKLLELAWGYDYEGDTRTVDVHIQKLRKKLGLDNRIRTVYKLGYRLEV